MTILCLLTVFDVFQPLGFELVTSHRSCRCSIFNPSWLVHPSVGLSNKTSERADLAITFILYSESQSIITSFHLFGVYYIATFSTKIPPTHSCSTKMLLQVGETLLLLLYMAELQLVASSSPHLTPELECFYGPTNKILPAFPWYYLLHPDCL